jgi:hypothetical protein
MPQCPFCNAAVWTGQQYCTTCDKYLPQPNEGDQFCPQCSIRVAPQQEICHKCKTALPESPGTPSTATTGALMLRFGVLGIFIGTCLVIVALLLVFLFNESHSPPKLAETPPPQAALDRISAAPPIPSPAETSSETPTSPVPKQPAVPPEPEIPSPPKVTIPAASPLMYVVNAYSLALWDGPSMSATQIATLNFNDEVELLETSGGWGKVRDVRRNIVGWSFMRYLSPSGG